MTFPNKDGVYYFMEDPTAKCFTKQHHNMIVFAYISLVYVIGVPILIPFLIWRARAALNAPIDESHVSNEDEHSKSSESNSSSVMTPASINIKSNLIDSANGSIAEDLKDGLYFYYGNYRKKYFFWESIEMMRKVLLTTVAVFIGGSSLTALCLLIILSGMFAVSHAHFQPIANRTEHYLQLISLFAIFSNLIIGTSMSSTSSTESSGEKDLNTLLLTVILMVCNSVVGIFLMGTLSFFLFLFRTCFLSLSLIAMKPDGAEAL